MLVSVIVPCYNQGKFLNETLESVYKQTYLEWECIMVDDGSTDDTMKIAQSWAVKDIRFKYFYKENGGVSSARNLGIEQANGQYLQFLDADDLLAPQKLELSLDAFSLSNNNAAEIVVSNFMMISIDSKGVYPPSFEFTKESLTFENFLYNSFSIQLQYAIFEGKLFDTIRFSENLSAQEDWVVWIKLLKITNKIDFIDKPLSFYRINPDGRMNTLGIEDNQIKVLGSLKEVLTYEEYYNFSVNILSKYYDSYRLYRKNLNLLKKSNSYKLVLIIKKILKKIGVLKIMKKFLK
ncbi:glycosyltransferase family 2 protein [Polaribacter atrinae]|nr:glycosyltransferase family A protein [Polaribacter atrinae]